MIDEKRFLEDVGIRDLPSPMKVTSRVLPEGQPTVANVSIAARILREFEAGWIDKCIQIAHQHRDRIGTRALRRNILDYLKGLRAKSITIDLTYPFFVEKRTPVSNEKCLVRYTCTYSAKMSSVDKQPRVLFKIEVPVISTYPGSAPEKPGGLFGQLTIVSVHIESREEAYPEDLVELIDRHALAPIYSFLTPEDQAWIIKKVHSEVRSSVVVTDAIREELARSNDVEWYSVRCSNYGMLHSYSTVIQTEKSLLVPFSSYDEDEP